MLGSKFRIFTSLLFGRCRSQSQSPQASWLMALPWPVRKPGTVPYKPTTLNKGFFLKLLLFVCRSSLTLSFISQNISYISVLVNLGNYYFLGPYIMPILKTFPCQSHPSSSVTHCLAFCLVLRTIVPNFLPSVCPIFFSMVTHPTQNWVNWNGSLNRSVSIYFLSQDFCRLTRWCESVLRSADGLYSIVLYFFIRNPRSLIFSVSPPFNSAKEKILLCFQ